MSVIAENTPFERAYVTVVLKSRTGIGQNLGEIIAEVT